MCQHITEVKQHTRLVILQHPAEAKNSKNTVRLLKLLTDNIEIHIGESRSDFLHLKDKILSNKDQYFLLFPGSQAKTFDSYQPAAERPVYNLIIIDGTWRKAKKLLHQNPWLAELRHLTLDSSYNAQYGIRKTSIDNGLSTIEAVAYCLREMENIELTPFFTALEGLKQNFTKLMPTKVANRYK